MMYHGMALERILKRSFFFLFSYRSRKILSSWWRCFCFCCYFQSIYYLVRVDCWHILLISKEPQNHTYIYWNRFLFLYFKFSQFVRKLEIEMKKKMVANRERERKNDKCFGIDFNVWAPSVPLLNAIGQTIEKSKCEKRKTMPFLLLLLLLFALCFLFHQNW